MLLFAEFVSWVLAFEGRSSQASLIAACLGPSVWLILPKGTPHRGLVVDVFLGLDWNASTTVCSSGFLVRLDRRIVN